MTQQNIFTIISVRIYYNHWI